MRERSTGRMMTFGARSMGGLITVFVLASGRLFAQEPLTLEACIDVALRQSPTIAVSQQQLAQAQGQHQTVRATLLPNIEASSFVSRRDPSRLSPIGSGTGSLFSTESFVGLTGSQLLFDGGRATALRRAASSAVLAQQAGVQATRADTVFAVTQAFSTLLVADGLVGVAQTTLKQRRDFESLTNAFFAAGKVTRLDVVTAEAQALDAEQRLESAIEDQRIAAALLQEAMGVEPREGFRVAGDLPHVMRGPLPAPELISAAQANSPDLQKLRYQVQQAQDGLLASRRAYLPAVSVTAGYDYRQYDIGAHAFEYTAGVNVSLPVFDSGAIKGEIASARALFQQQQASLRGLDLQVQTAVQQTLAAWRKAAANVRSGLKLVEASQASVDTALGLYQAGKATSLDVLSAQSQLALAEGELLQARGAYAVARAQMVRLTNLKEVSTP